MIGASVLRTLPKRAKGAAAGLSGEIIGTGVLGGMACYPIATLVMGKEAALFICTGILLSTAVGATISILAIRRLAETRAQPNELALGRNKNGGNAACLKKSCKT